MGSQDDMHAAIAALHAASLGDASWEHALDHVLVATGFAGASLWSLRNLADLAAGRAIWHRLDTAGKNDYINHYARIDPSVPLLDDPVANRILYDYLALSETDINRSEYYAWHEPASGMRYRLGGVTRPTLPFFASVTLHRPKSRGHATGAEIDRFRLLFDHIEHALDVEYRLNLQRGIAGGIATAATDTGCIILDHAGRPVFVNDTARQLAPGVVSLRPDGVATPGGEQDRVLQALIASCLDTARGVGITPGGALRLPRVGKRDLVATVSPMPRAGSGTPSLGPSVCLLIVDPDCDRAPDETLLRRLYGLSPAEASLVGRLVLGDTLREAASARGISFATARSYLEQIFHRTGTRRQVDLVRLLLALPRPPPGR